VHNGVLAAGESISDNDLLLNGDKGYCVDGSNEGDRDRGVRDGSDDGLNSDGKLIDDILGGSRENKDDAFDLVVIADLFLGRPGGLCILACCFFS